MSKQFPTSVCACLLHSIGTDDIQNAVRETVRNTTATGEDVISTRSNEAYNLLSVTTVHNVAYDILITTENDAYNVNCADITTTQSNEAYESVLHTGETDR